MSSAAQVWEYRTLVGNLAIRELKSRYKKSVLGWAWSLINPAVNLAIYTVVFGYFLKGVAPTMGNGKNQAFALWLFAALVAWNAFSGGINISIGSFLAAGPMLTRTFFPPECPVIAGMFTVVLQTMLETTVLMGFMIGFGNIGWTFLYVIPIVLLLTAFSLGLGMLTSLLNVRYRDVAYLVAIMLQVLFYATPIVYRIDLIPQDFHGINTATLLGLNPLTHFVGAMRESTYLLTAPTLNDWFAMVLAATLSLGFGWWFFSRRAPRYIEEI
jgi:ABC-type polysaccharide/polyol phosphate export permease